MNRFARFVALFTLITGLSFCVLRATPSVEAPSTDVAAQVVRVLPHRVGFSTANDAGVALVTTSTTRQVFVTNVVTNPIDNSADITYVCWLTAPAAYVHPVPNKVSAVPLSTVVSWGATASEVTQIQNGNIVEVVGESGFQPAGTGQVAIENFLQNRCGAAQQALIGLAPSSGLHVVGLNYDLALADGGGGWNNAP